MSESSLLQIIVDALVLHGDIGTFSSRKNIAKVAHMRKKYKITVEEIQ